MGCVPVMGREETPLIMERELHIRLVNPHQPGHEACSDHYNVHMETAQAHPLDGWFNKTVASHQKKIFQ